MRRTEGLYGSVASHSPPYSSNLNENHIAPIVQSRAESPARVSREPAERAAVEVMLLEVLVQRIPRIWRGPPSVPKSMRGPERRRGGSGTEQLRTCHVS